MFSNLNKPAFGTTTTTPSFGFGNTAAPNQSPFGQSQLFGKPATSGFGTATPLFGANAQQPPSSLFGTTGSTFGAAPQQTGFGTTGLFGQQQNVQTGTTLFGNTNASTFGQQNKPTTFGFGSTATPLFGQQQQQQFQPSTSSGLFGASNAFGATAQTGTVVKFNPVTGTDTMQKSGITHSISTKHHCITCMKEYENKSLEELRWEDYQSNRKGPQQQQQSGFGGFGTTPSTVPSLFGAVPENKPAFGQINTFAPSSSSFGLTSQANQPSMFGKPTAGFGTPTTSTFGFNTTSTAFGNTATVKPFGATPAQNVFGTTTTQSGFGTSLFGQPNTQTSTGGFFNKPAQPAFSTQQPMFSFGQPATTTQTSFFQAKPSTGFGSFGQTNLTTNTGFGQQPSLFSQPTQNPFNTFAKPAQSVFGQQMQPSFGLGSQPTTGTNLFGTANKPMFGNTAQSNFFTPATSGFMMSQPQQTVGLTSTMDSQLDFHTVVEKIYEPFPRYSFLDDLDISKPACHNTTNPVVLKEIMDNTTVPVSPTNDINKFRILHHHRGSYKEPKFSMLEDVANVPSPANWKGKRLHLNKTTEKEQLLTVDTNMSLNNDRKEDIIVESPEWYLHSGEKQHHAMIYLCYQAAFALKTISTPNIMEQIWKKAEKARESLIPSKSEAVYHKEYKIYLKWLTQNTVMPKDATETVLLAYFQESSETYSPNSLWTKWSMLKSMPTIHEKRDITKFNDLEAFLKRMSKSYKPKKSTVVSPNDVIRFLKNAPNEIHLLHKIASSMHTLKGLKDSAMEKLVQYKHSPIPSKHLNLGSETTVTNTIYTHVTQTRSTNVSMTMEKPEDDERISTPTRKEDSNPRAVRFEDEPEVDTSFIDVTESEDVDTCGIRLERPEYYTLPPLSDIHKFKNELGTCTIKGFTVGRVGYGNIYFPDPIDVANLNLDEIVHIRYREVIVYTDDDNKPPIGEGLNRPAQVTIDRVWPRDPDTKQMIKDTAEIIKNNFVERLASISEKQNAKFVDYRPETGSWVFTVEHFSKYKYIDDADDESTAEAEKSFQNLEIKRAEEKKQLEIQQEIEEVQLESTKRGLGGFSLMDQSAEDHTSFIQSFSKPHRFPESKSVVLMKSAFFDEESVSDDVSSSEIAVRHFDTPIVHDVTLMQPRKLRTDKPKQYALHSFPQIVPIAHSMLILPNYMDMQVFRGRSFKVGWGRGYTLVALPGTKGISNVDDNSVSSNMVMHLEISCVDNKTATLNIEDHMKVILSESVISLDRYGIPTCSIIEGSKCLENLKLVANDENVCYEDVWDLCLAFWGPCATTPTEHNELFSEWLENVASPHITAELESLHSKSAILKNIFRYLTGHQIDEAANLAMEAGFPRLAVLIPACSNNTSRLLIYNQLHVWKETGALNHIHKDLIKIYMLLGGIPVTSDVNSCESLDWKRSLAIHFWYMCPAGISLTASLQLYQKAFLSGGYACRPSPEYYKCNDDGTNDVLYNIMLLFASKNLSLYNILNPATYSENPLDSRLSWFLLQVFSALKTGTISENVNNFICVSFASQLEHLGLWQWAIFVLLFVKDKSVKCNLIMGILDRNLEPSRSSKNIAIEDFLVNDIQICPNWIHSTLAQKTALLDNHLETFQHLILANDYSKAHTTAVKHLIPKFIKTRQLDLLTKLLKDLLPGRDIIWHWNTQSGFILDFLEVYHKIINYRDELSDFDQRNIKSALNTLCLQMKEFPLESPHQSKALAKIGQFIAELVMIVYCELESGPKNKEVAGNLIRALIMPYDYIHNELEKLSNKKG